MFLLSFLEKAFTNKLKLYNRKLRVRQMNSIQQLKLSNFAKNTSETRKQVAGSIAKLNADLSAAIGHQVYARKNPDSNVDTGLLEHVGAGFEEQIPYFYEIKEKIDDLIAVKNGAMTVDEIATKYGKDALNYSADLLDK
ncbi:MAG: hypothetical protein ACJAUY_000679 [Cognaticolwellia sp.]|jgi:hypothetical protein